MLVHKLGYILGSRQLTSNTYKSCMFVVPISRRKSWLTVLSRSVCSPKVSVRCFSKVLPQILPPLLQIDYRAFLLNSNTCKAPADSMQFPALPFSSFIWHISLLIIPMENCSGCLTWFLFATSSWNILLVVNVVWVSYFVKSCATLSVLHCNCLLQWA